MNPSMTFHPPLVKRAQLDAVLAYDAKRARFISMGAVFILSVLTILSSLGYFNQFWSTPLWLKAIITPEVLLGLDIMAILAWINVRFPPDIWLSSIFCLPIAAVIWIVARSVIITTYLAQEQFQSLLHTNANNSLELIIYTSVAEQNFTIVTLSLMLALWAAFIRLQADIGAKTLTITTAALLSIFTILNGARLLIEVPDFFLLWILLVSFSTISLLLMAKIRLGSKI